MIGGYAGTVTKVSSDGRHVEVFLGLLRIATRMLPCCFPLGLVIAPRRGDEVLVVPTGGGIEDGVVIGWMPRSDDLAAAKKVVVSNNGALPTWPGGLNPAPIENASVTNVKVRLPEVE